MRARPWLVVTSGRQPSPASFEASITKLDGDALPVRLPAERLHQPHDGAGRHGDQVRRAPKPFAHRRDDVGDADRLGIGHEICLVLGRRRGERERDRRRQIFEGEQRAAIGETGERQRHRRLGERGQRGDIAFDALAVDDGGAEHGERNAALREKPLASQLGPSIGVGGQRRILFGDDVLGRNADLRPDR